MANGKIDDFYLRFTLINNEYELLIKFLEENNIIYEKFTSAFNAFIQEEAEVALENHLYDCLDDNALQATIMNHKEALGDEFANDDYFINTDLEYEITGDYCYENIPAYREMIDNG